MADPKASAAKVTRARKPDTYGWKGVGAVLGVDPTTARRWADAGLPVFVWGKWMVVAYEDELLAWALRARPTREARRQQLELPLGAAATA